MMGAGEKVADKVINALEQEFWEALDRLVSGTELVIDRPRGSAHPRYGFRYPLDYGYLKDTASMDGGGIDVWRGSLDEPKLDAIICTVDLKKRDSEMKLLLGCTNEEKETIYHFHNDNHDMKGILIPRDRE
jgi:inorganic pyrophosphatase